MNKTRLLLSVGFILSLLFLSISPVLAEEGIGGHKMGKMKEKWEQKKAEMHKELGVTPEQEAKLKEHREKNHAQMEGLHEQIKAKKEAIQQELEKTDVDTAKVRQIHSELKALKGQIEDARLESILGVREILSAEQFSKFMKMKDDWKEKGKESMKKRFKQDDK